MGYVCSARCMYIGAAEIFTRDPPGTDLFSNYFSARLLHTTPVPARERRHTAHINERGVPTPENAHEQNPFR